VGLRQRSHLIAGEWKELNPATASKELSGQGRLSMSPTRKSPSESRSRATSIESGDASSPATLAPRESGHVDPDLGDDDLRANILDAGD
jgi:hypothetical protein